MRIIITLFAFLLLCYPVLAQQAPSPSMGVVLTDQNPYPVEPGQNVNIEIEVQNTGGWQARNQVLEIIPTLPFTLLPGEEETKTFSLISALSSVKTSYNLRVDNNALTNQYELEFRIYGLGSTATYITDDIIISVQGEPELVLSGAEISDGVPGGLTNLTVDIKNIGTGTARRMMVNFSSSEELKPILAGGLIHLGDLTPGKSATASIELSISSQAEHKTYTSTLTASYLDENGDAQAKTFTIGMPVKGSVILDIIKIEPDFGRGKLNIDVANKGTTEAKSLEATLTVDGEVVDIDYTSSLKANKKVTFDFPIILKGIGTLTINYIGPGIEENKITEEVVLNFMPPTQDNTGTYILLLIIAVVVIYYLCKKGKLKCIKRAVEHTVPHPSHTPKKH